MWWYHQTRSRDNAAGMASATFNHHIRPHPLLAPPPQPLGRIRSLKLERFFYSSLLKANKLVSGVRECNLLIAAYLPPSQSSSASRTHFNPSTKLFVSGQLFLSPLTFYLVFLVIEALLTLCFLEIFSASSIVFYTICSGVCNFNIMFKCWIFLVKSFRHEISKLIKDKEK